MQQNATNRDAKAGANHRALILASASPRRRMLLEEAGYQIHVCPAQIHEFAMPGEAPADLVRRLAREKAWAVAPTHPNSLVLGADTIVLHNGTVLGKPGSVVEARTMLRTLSGTTHDVLTGVCICRQAPRLDHAWSCTTTVTFKTLDDRLIRTYMERVHVLDKAGSYGIQEYGDMLVAAVDGLQSNVVGLPIEDVVQFLNRLP